MFRFSAPVPSVAVVFYNPIVWTNMKELVSFYMTVKDGMPFLSDSIGSLRAQTYPEWEAVVVDDGSRDGTSRFLQEISGLDNRFRVVLTGGIGRAKALNLAVSMAKGSLIANLDADDVTHPERAEIQASFFHNHDLHVDFLSAPSLVFQDVGDVVWGGMDAPSGELSDLTKKIMRSNPFAHSSVMIRKSVFERVGGYDEARRKQIDYELWGRLAASGYRLYKLDGVLTGKRIHAGQSFENKDRIAYLLSSISVQKSIIKNMGGGSMDYLSMIARGGAGLLPQQVRMLARRLSR